MAAVLSPTHLVIPQYPGVREDGDAEAPSSHYAAIYALALGTFAVGTEGFMIAALLPTISHSLSVSIPLAGQLVTVFALVYALSSPILTALTASLPRRSVLIGALFAFAAANLIAAIAPSFWPLAAARVLLALSAGLYVPNANALASILVAPQHRGRALGIVNGGITVAITIGVPLGAFVGAHLGWRATFIGVAVLSGAALGAIIHFLPRDVTAPAPASLRARLAVVGGAGVFPTLLTTTFWALGAYVVYTYISLYLSVTAMLTPGEIGLILMVYGLSALLGVTLSGVAVDRFGSMAVQAFALPTMAAAFATLSAVGLLSIPHATLAIIPLIAIWGISSWSFFPAQQNRLIGIVGLPNTPIVLSLNAFLHVSRLRGRRVRFDRYLAFWRCLDWGRRRLGAQRRYCDVPLCLVTVQRGLPRWRSRRIHRANETKG